MAEKKDVIFETIEEAKDAVVANCNVDKVSDKTIEFCLQIMDCPQFQYELELSKSKKKILFHTNLKSFCSENDECIDLDNALAWLNNLTEENSKKLFYSSCGNMACSTNGSTICSGCEAPDCVKEILSWILVFREKGVLEEKLSKRTKSIGTFRFEWKTKDGLKTVPENVYQLAKHMVDNHLVTLNCTLTDKGYMKSYFPFGCSYIIDSTDIEKFDPKKASKKRSEWKILTRSTNRDLDYLCSGLDCRLPHCPLMVASYIYYLKKLGKENQIEADRAYYAEHKEEIDKEVNEKYQEKLEKYLKTRIDPEITKKFEGFENLVDNLDLLKESIANKDRQNVYFAIEREEGVDETELMSVIEDSLKEMEKINNVEWVKFGNFFDQKSRPTIQDNVLYIVHKFYDSLDPGDKATKKTLDATMLQDLCHPQDNRYFIMVGTKEELERLRSYSEKLKYVYGHFNATIKNLTMEQLYDVYKQWLETVPMEELNKDEKEAERKFADFVVNNRSIFPFKNADFAKYISQYSNSYNSLQFPPYAYHMQTLDESLSNVVGLDSIKKQIKDLEQYMIFMNKAKAIGLNAPANSMHMAFTGLSGTGKTMMGKIMARMLYDIGAVKDNKFVEVSRKDLVAHYTGQTASKALDAFGQAIGGVLFIDDAVSLVDNYGREAMEAISKAMDDNVGNIVVIFSGHKDEMKVFMEKNPNVASRVGYMFDFPNYTPDELVSIAKIKMEAYGFELSEDAAFEYRNIFNVASKKKNFGNGRFVERLIQMTLIKHAKTASKDIKIITRESVPTMAEINHEVSEKHDPKKAFDDIVGMSNLKSQFYELMDYAKFVKSARDQGISPPSMSLHMLFTGNPGTGKTMMARIIARTLFDMDIIHENKLVEVERKDLIGKYIGETAIKCSEVIEKALGGVLFIDEAYSLTQSGSSNDYGGEAIATLIKATEDKKDELIVIFAGYRNEMTQFVNSNPGIASRIGFTFNFEDYTPDELAKILELKIIKSNLKITDKALHKFLNLAKSSSNKKNFGNGRFVDRALQHMLINHARNCSDDISTIDESSIPTLSEMNGYDEAAIKPINLDHIVGMTQVKKQIQEFIDYAKFIRKAEDQDIHPPTSNLHMLFTGNPGTGKTMMARLIAQALFEAGVLHENKLIEVERKDLIGEYIGQTAPKTAEVISKAMGGVLFIDEAYSLTQSGSDKDFGSEAISTLIKAMEDSKGQFAIIFAGYRDEMTKFINSNPGIESRIGYKFHFEDYSPNELCEILKQKLKKCNMAISDNALKKFFNLARSAAGRKNFGNGRFVDRALQHMMTEHAKTCGGNISVIQESSVPTLSKLSGYDDAALNNVDFNSIIGMEHIKHQINEFIDYVKFTKEAEENGIRLPANNLHMLFTGNPGTGKTMMARLVAKALFDSGILPENKLVEVSCQNLYGSRSGENAQNMLEAIDEASGGVLFIDEAYSLVSKSCDGLNWNSQELITTLIKEMEDRKGQFAIIFAGYRDEMKIFVDSNPGVASRIGYTFHFEDYNVDELIEIFKMKINKCGLKITDDAIDEAKHITSVMCKRKNFGNGRFVDKLLQNTLSNHAKNRGKDISLIDKCSIPTIEELNGSGNTKKKQVTSLDDIVGMKDLKEKLREFESYISFSQKARDAGMNIPAQNMHMLFTGNPGCGKTTVARIIAKMLFEMDVLHENKLIEVERKDLIGEYIGKTAPKTSEIIERAMGGVLFIDEAYSLTPSSGNDYGHEAIATLIKAMEDHKGEFVVIFAGYKREMQKFVNANSGIASRIGYTFDFPDYTPDELSQIFEIKIKKSGFRIDGGVNDVVRNVMRFFHKVENIGNGRFADKIAQMTIMNHAKRQDCVLDLIDEKDIPSIDEVTKSLSNGSEILSQDSINPTILKTVAIHEIGHAYVRYKLFKDPKFVKITINAEGRGTLGYVEYESDNDAIMPKSMLLNKVKVSLAGMCAEEIFMGEFANGNTSDLENATNIIRNMVTKYGMSSLGFAQIKDANSLPVQDEISRMMNECYENVKTLIKNNQKEIVPLINYLITNKEITGEEFMKLMKSLSNANTL